MRATIILKILLLNVILLSSAMFANSQHKVTGTIIDEHDNISIPGVLVTVKGTTTSTTSDEYGKYSIEVPSVNSVLVFIFVGFDSNEQAVNGRKVIDVKMKQTLTQLDEMIVVGLGSSGTNYSGEDMRISQKGKHYKQSEPSIYAARPSAQYDKFYQYSNAEEEEYGSFTENSFQMVQNVPLSTFSIDVDAASYSNIRRFINQGQIPPKYAVRTEELINYFNYDYAQPKGKHPINVISEVSDCPWNSQNRLLHIGIKAKEIPADKLPGSNLVFLIDVSGSMSSANRLPLVKASMKMLVNQLRDIDKVAIVTYAGSAGVNLESTSGKEKTKISNSIDKLVASGSTAGGEGIKLAYKIAKENFIKDGNNRIILASDGDFNVGVSSNSDLEKLIETERKSGVFLTVLGYGIGNYKDSKMQVLAEKGNGNHAYIDNLTEAKKVLVSEFAGTLFTIAKDVKLQLEFNPARVQAYRLIGYESRMLNKEDFNNDVKDAGEMGSGHTVTALYEIIPVGVKSNIIGSVDNLKYQPDKNKPTQSSKSNELLTVKIRYKAPDGDTSEKIERPVFDIKTPLLITSNNFRFSAAVAQAGMLLYDSPYKSESSYDKAIILAKNAYGDDKEGYRHEFVKLLENVQLMIENDIK